MTEIQEYLLKLTLEIDEICTEYDIDYILCGGASLGAERNGGFLPWDDDLDIIMTEKNYHKFLKVMQEHPREGRVVESPETNPEFPLHFAKYMSVETCALVRTLGYGNSSGGIWIDIFYLSPVSKDPEEAKTMLEWYQAYCEFQNRRYPEVAHYAPGLTKKFRKALRMSRFLGYQGTLKWMEKKFNFVKEEDCDRYFIHHCLTPIPTVKTYSKKHLEHAVRMPFEGHMLPFSWTNREFCREAYGDSWMMIPDLVEQDTHDAIYDTSIPYTVFRNDYMQMLDKETVDKDLFEYKKAELYYKHDFYDSNRSVTVLQAMVDEKEMEDTLDVSELQALAEERKWGELNERFADYSQALGNRIYSTYDCFPELDPAEMEIYLEMLIRYRGRWAYADKMMQKYFHLPEHAVTRLKKLIDHCRTVSIARYDARDQEQTREAIAAFRAFDSDYCFEVDMAELDLACKQQDTEEIRKLLDRCLRFYPEGTEEILLGTAILQKQSGDPAVQDTLKTLFETGHNGVLLMDVRKGLYGLSI